MSRSLGVLTWLRLARTHQKIQRAATIQLKPFALSPAQFDVLAHVGAAEGLGQQELADSLLVTKGNVCQLLDRLEGRGLIERRQEGRANRLYLTEVGRALFSEVVPAHEAAIAEILSSLAPAQQIQLLRLLRKLDGRLESDRRAGFVRSTRDALRNDSGW